MPEMQDGNPGGILTEPARTAPLIAYGDTKIRDGAMDLGTSPGVRRSFYRSRRG